MGGDEEARRGLVRHQAVRQQLALQGRQQRPTSPHAEEDNRIARLAIRYILCNPAITAPIPGLITVEQVDNVALAVKERRELDEEEKAELDRAMDRAWANLPVPLPVAEGLGVRVRGGRLEASWRLEAGGLDDWEAGGLVAVKQRDCAVWRPAPIPTDI